MKVKYDTISRVNSSRGSVDIDILFAGMEESEKPVRISINPSTIGDRKQIYVHMSGADRLTTEQISMNNVTIFVTPYNFD